jgi:hypothetical protein
MPNSETVENSSDARESPVADEGALPSSDPYGILPSVFKLLLWLRSTRPDLFLTVVNPVSGHKELLEED